MVYPLAPFIVHLYGLHPFPLLIRMCFAEGEV